MGLRPFILVLLLALAGCEQRHWQGASAEPLLEPPPQLWKITAVQAASDAKAIQLCADGRLASGFTFIAPEIGGHRCSQEGRTNGDPPNQSYKCQINGQAFGVATTVSGRYPEDFTAVSSVVDIDSQRTVYSRSLHFSHIGLCPAGWTVGQATDQGGRRIAAAFVAGTDTVYQAQ